ncbi:uncharacterized protein PADG_02500 [Paracoccidioides brasiliensis Pb18]|uniref:Uncharacterized protein n=1 Tax=Paracoccidioides brasiliensis (strain Pb18) TaxID=502780 RepID=C1G5P5_PARBD|nr:uncharacterized protein PADG_02500 [Paracoccidioides brasiliensis Pb18]EEH46402.1 hypothetical protein PADG_02500 [Paracoccidioides brasiliensis Pb18]
MAQPREGLEVDTSACYLLQNPGDPQVLAARNERSRIPKLKARRPPSAVERRDGQQLANDGN